MDKEVIISELKFKTSRSGGPGGQHVNKTETQVEVLFCLKTSKGLSEEEKLRAMDKLSNRIDTHSNIHVVANNTRSQIRNRREAIARLLDLLTDSIEIPKQRKPSKPSIAAKKKRLEGKSKQAERKKSRAWKYGD